MRSLPTCPLHYITLLHYTLHYITLHYITLHYITSHYITLHYITLHYITLRYITLHYIILHYYITLHSSTFRCEQGSTVVLLSGLLCVQDLSGGGSLCLSPLTYLYTVNITKMLVLIYYFCPFQQTVITVTLLPSCILFRIHKEILW